jgi:hypothetical protein
MKSVVSLSELICQNRIKIVQAGALHPLITLLRSASRRVQEQALGCLRDLSVAPENKTRVVQEGGLPHVIGLLRSREESIRELACWTIRNLAVNAENKVLHVDAGANVLGAHR